MLILGTSVGVQWLKFQASTVEGVGSFLVGELRPLHVAWWAKKKKRMLILLILSSIILFFQVSVSFSCGFVSSPGLSR